MIEVEVKAKIDNFKGMQAKLEELGAVKVREEHQEDMYFNSPIKDFAKTDEALRIRKTVTEGKNHVFITYKGPKIDSSSKTREEIEVAIEDGKKVSSIFERIGFKQVSPVVKDREIYELNEYIISLDDVKGLGPHMEIEVDLDDEANFKPSLNRIFETFKKLGVEDGFERRSYLELLENS